MPPKGVEALPANGSQDLCNNRPLLRESTFSKISQALHLRGRNRGTLLLQSGHVAPRRHALIIERASEGRSLMLIITQNLISC